MSKASADEPDLSHCMRCHECFNPDEDADDKCVIEHDFDSFEGSRNGGSYYEGVLTCCGASHHFHRYYSEESTHPEYCFKGNHTADPSEAQYNMKTIKPCGVQTCGKELHDMAMTALKNQQDEANHREQQEKREREEYWKKRIEEAPPDLARREARRARAERLGLDPDAESLNSENDSGGCEEFDCASDSSLECPF